MLVVQVWLIGNAFILFGLIETHGIFACYPLMIAALAVAEPSRLQPLACFKLIFAAAAGGIVFGEPLPLTTILGATLVLAAGLFNLRQAR